MLRVLIEATAMVLLVTAIAVFALLVTGGV